MPKRPSRVDAQRNLARIVEVAREVFGERGTSAGMDEIAKAAGVGVGTLYRHFATKEALIAEIVREQIEKTAEDAEAQAKRRDAGAAFFEFLERLWSSGSQKKALVDALAGSSIDMRKLAASSAQKMRRALAKLLARAQAEGAVRDDVEVADVLALLGASLTAARTGTRNRIFEIVRDGLRPR